MRGEADLARVIQALGRLGLGLGLGQRREQQRGQDGDNGNDHQQLNQREGLPVGMQLLTLPSPDRMGRGWPQAK